MLPTSTLDPLPQNRFRKLVCPKRFHDSVIIINSWPTQQVKYWKRPIYHCESVTLFFTSFSRNRLQGLVKGPLCLSEIYWTFLEGSFCLTLQITWHHAGYKKRALSERFFSCILSLWNLKGFSQNSENCKNTRAV